MTAKRTILIIVCTLLAGFAVSPVLPANADADDTPRPLVLPLDAFEYHVGEPIGSAPPTQDPNTVVRGMLNADHWHPLSQFNLEALEDHHDLFVRIKLPLIRWTHPAVYMSAFLNGFDVYLGTRPIYQYGWSARAMHKQRTNPTAPKDFDYFQSHIISLDDSYRDQCLLIRINYQAPNNFGEIYSMMIGNREDLYQVLIQDKSDSFENGVVELLLGYLLILIGVLSLCTFVIRWRDHDYAFLSFSFFAVCVGLRYLNTLNPLLKANLSPSVYDYIESLTFLLVPVGLFAFVENIFGPGWRKIVRRLWQFHLLLTLVFIGLTYFHLAYDFRYIPVFILLGSIIGLSVILKSDRFHHPRIKILFTGFFSLFIFLLLCKLLEMLGIITVVYDLFGWGTLVLIFALGYTLVEHYTETDRRMRSVSLELVRNKNELLKLQRANLESQLEALKNQINPHFLFNTFSTLVSIIEDNPRLAVDYVQELSKIYRYVLQTKVSQLIGLQEELNFVRSYEFLLSKRFGDKFSVAVTVSEADLKCLIPPLSLQLLVENAVKHNVISSKQPLVVEIYREGHSLVIKNKIQKKRATQSPTRIGLKNIRDRYRFFTPEEVQIISDQDYFTVKIPLLSKDEENLCKSS